MAAPLRSSLRRPLSRKEADKSMEDSALPTDTPEQNRPALSIHARLLALFWALTALCEHLWARRALQRCSSRSSQHLLDGARQIPGPRSGRGEKYGQHQPMAGSMKVLAQGEEHGKYQRRRSMANNLRYIQHGVKWPPQGTVMLWRARSSALQGQVREVFLFRGGLLNLRTW